MSLSNSPPSKNQKALSERWQEATLWCDVKELTACLKAGQDPNETFEYHATEGVTALMISAIKGDQACFDLLYPISNPRLRDHDGADALIYALQGRGVRHAIVDQLILKADPTVKMKNGMSALWCAVSRTEDLLAVEKLIGFNDPYEMIDNVNVLSVTLAQGKLLMAKCLLSRLDIRHLQKNAEHLDIMLGICKSSPLWSDFVQDVQNRLKADREQQLLEIFVSQACVSKGGEADHLRGPEPVLGDAQHQATSAFKRKVL